MSLKLIKILIIFLYLKNPTIFGDNDENITLAPLPAFPFNFTPEPRVVRGYRPEPHTLAKYILSLRQTSETEHEFGCKHFCAGSIIGANRILTVAHCVFEEDDTETKPSAIKVVARNSMRCKRTPETEEIAVKEIISHRKYNGLSMFNDIALLILVKDIQLDGKLAEKISLPQQDIQPDKLCTVIGWGETYAHGPSANNLLYVDVHVRSRKYCRKKLPLIGGKKICASNKYDKEMDSCQGDSGGPLICSNGNDVVVGIVSYGYGCAEGIPGVYTNVYRYLDWINTGKGSRLKPLPNMLRLSVINQTIFADNHANITLAPLPALQFNFTPEPRTSGGYRPESHTLAKYIVSLRKTSEIEHEFGYSHFCGGSIIGANRILNAAHCVFNKKNVKTNPSTIKVVAKNSIRLKRTVDTEEIAVKAIILHSKYSRPSRFHDISLLILVNDIQLDGKLAEKISLPQQNIQPDKLCKVIGWGKMYAHGPLANNLLYGDIHLCSRKYCRKWLPNISSKKICAFNKYDDEINICKGDSGGPLICSNGKDVVVGIVSYGYGCVNGTPGVYTNVYRYLDWINEAKGNHLKPLPYMLCLCVFVCLCILR